MPMYNRGACACCNPPICDPVSFEFQTLSFLFDWTQAASGITTITIIAAVVVVTHSTGRVQTIDVHDSPDFNYVNLYYQSPGTKKYETQGYFTLCGKTAQWRVVFSAPSANETTKTYTLADATSVGTYTFS